MRTQRLKGNFRQSLISQTFCSHSRWFSTAIRAVSRLTLCFQSTKVPALFCSLQTTALLWHARLVSSVDCSQICKAALFLIVLVRQWVKTNCCLQLFFSRIIAITFNSLVNLSSTSRSSQALPRFSNCKLSFGLLKRSIRTQKAAARLRNTTLLSQISWKHRDYYSLKTESTQHSKPSWKAGL